MKRYLLIFLFSFLPQTILASTQLEAQKIVAISMGWGSEGVYIHTDKK